MKKKWIIAIAITVTVLLAGTVLLFVWRSSGNNTDDGDKDTSVSETEDASVNTTDPLQVFEEEGIIGTTNPDGSLRLLCGDLAENLPVRDTDDVATLIDHYSEQLGIADFAEEFGNENTITHADGTSYRYQQIHNGIAVIGGDLCVTTDAEGTPLVIINNRVALPEDFDTTITVSEDAAAEAAMLAISTADGYDRFVTLDTSNVILVPEESTPYYAWQFTFEVDPYTTYYAIVSTTDKTKVTFSSNMYNIVATGKNSFGETKSFSVYEGDAFFLIDEEHLLSLHNYVPETDGYNYIFRETNHWPNPTEVDLITNFATVQDFVHYALGLNSIDNQGIELAIVNNYINNEEITNACWLGFRTNQSGNAAGLIAFAYNPNGEPPFTMCLDVCAHEYGHGLYQYFRSGYDKLFFNLPATNAFSEAYADILGCCVDGDWIIGEEYYTLKPGTKTCIRSIENPDVNDGFRIAMPMSYNPFEKSIHYHNATILSHVAYKMNTRANISFEDLACIWTNALRFVPSSPSFNDVRDAVFVSAVQLSKFSQNIQLTDEQLMAILTYFEEANLYGREFKKLDLDKAGSYEQIEKPDNNDIGSVELELVLENISADSIQYYNCSESGNFAVIERDGKFGIIGYDGTLIQPIIYASIAQGNGYVYDQLCAADQNDNYYFIDKNGQAVPGGGGGGDVRPSAYWYDEEVVIFNAQSDIISLDEFLKDEYHGDKGLLNAGMVLSFREWNDEKIFPIQQISGYINHNGYYHEPRFDSQNYALLDMETNTLMTDFIYEKIDDHHGFSEGLFAVKKDGSWGFIDEEGNVIIDFLYDPYKVETFDYITEVVTFEYVYTATNGYIAVLQDGKWGLIDTEGNVVVETAYDGISQVNPDGMFWLKENGSWSLYKLNG